MLRELIENACRYNDSANAMVSVVASIEEHADYPIRVTVRDNGPGIPEYELYPIESGTETALEHGSGLGLWLVKWGVKSLNGQLEFEDLEPHGTAIHLHLPPLN